MAKLIATRVPMARSLAERTGAFSHGPMLDATYITYWVRTHMARVGRNDLRGLTVLELGPGDSIASALVAKALGAERVILVDAQAFATADVAVYRQLTDDLRAAQLDVVDLSQASSFDDVMDLVGATYLTDGLQSLRSLPSSSVDLSWSQAVLEHIRRDEVTPTLQELHRVHRSGTYTSHRVDLQDHLDRSLHSLRFRASTWESSILRPADFYTNRLRKHEVLDLFRQSGFDVSLIGERKWEHLPIPRSQLAHPYAAMSDAELLPYEIDFVGRTLER